MRRITSLPTIDEGLGLVHSFRRTGRVGILHLGKASPRSILTVQCLNLILSRPSAICAPVDIDVHALSMARPKSSHGFVMSSLVHVAIAPDLRNILPC